MASKYASKEVIPLANVKDVSVQGDSEIVEDPLGNLVAVKFSTRSSRKAAIVAAVIVLLIIIVGVLVGTILRNTKSDGGKDECKYLN